MSLYYVLKAVLSPTAREEFTGEAEDILEQAHIQGFVEYRHKYAFITKKGKSFLKRLRENGYS